MTDYLGAGFVVALAVVVAVLMCATITTLSSIIPSLIAVMVGIVGGPLTMYGALIAVDKSLETLK